MIYVIMGAGAFLLVPVVSIALFLWGIGGLVKGAEAVEVEDEET